MTDISITEVDDDGSFYPDLALSPGFSVSASSQSRCSSSGAPSSIILLSSRCASWSSTSSSSILSDTAVSVSSKNMNKNPKNKRNNNKHSRYYFNCRAPPPKILSFPSYGREIHQIHAAVLSETRCDRTDGTDGTLTTLEEKEEEEDNNENENGYVTRRVSGNGIGVNDVGCDGGGGGSGDDDYDDNDDGVVVDEAVHNNLHGLKIVIIKENDHRRRRNDCPATTNDSTTTSSAKRYRGSMGSILRMFRRRRGGTCHDGPMERGELMAHHSIIYELRGTSQQQGYEVQQQDQNA